MRLTLEGLYRYPECQYRENDTLMRKNFDAYLRHINITQDSNYESQHHIRIPTLMCLKLADDGNDQTETTSKATSMAELVAVVKNEVQRVSSEEILEQNYSVIEIQCKKAKPVEQEKVVEVMIEKPQEQGIKYFYHPAIKTKKEFKSLETKVIKILKKINESVRVTVYYRQAYGSISDEAIKDIIAQEVEKEQTGLPEFEKNLLICLIGNFGDLEKFVYPKDFKDMKREHNWIKANFDKYQNKLRLQQNSSELKKEVPQIDKLDNIFDRPTFKFCTDRVNVKEESVFPLTNTQLDLVRDLYTLDDTAIESLLSVFYVEYEEKPEELHIWDLLDTLCNSPHFEMKLLDFCMFFLHCPEHIQSQSNKFPYSSVFNKEEQNTSSLQVYQTVAKNIFKFFEKYLNKRNYILYQPRSFLEQYGLHSLQDFKNKHSYFERTSGFASIADLLIGALEIKEIVQAESGLQGTLLSLIESINNKPTQFVIKQVTEGEELIENHKILSTRSCQIIINLKKSEKILQANPEIATCCPKLTAKRIDQLISKIYSCIEKIVPVIKTKLNSKELKIESDDMLGLLDYQDDLVSLKAILKIASHTLASWILQRNQAQQEKTLINEDQQIYIKLLENLNDHILNEKTSTDLMMNAMELLTYLLQADQTPEIQSVSGYFGQIVTSYYCLVCSQSFVQQQLIRQSTDSIPDLCKIVSNDRFSELLDVPELSKTFSVLRMEKKFDFDILYTNLWRKHPDIMKTLLYEHKKEEESVNKVILLICKRIPCILDFQTKKDHLISVIDKKLRKIKVKTTRTINIDRENLLQSTLTAFTNKPSSKIRQKIRLNFTKEPGYDAGGLTREYYTIITKELFDPKTGLFKLSENGFSLQINPDSKIIPYHLNYLQLAGTLLAKAIYQDCLVDVNLTRSTLKHILGREISLADLEDIDSKFAKSLSWMLENPVDELEQSFTYETQILNDSLTKELIPNGSNTIVTDVNKKEFVRKICEIRLEGEIKEELEAFLRGFYMIIPAGCLDLFSLSELQLLISGESNIDIEDLKTNVELEGYTENDDIVKWMWEILEEFNQKERSAFIFFISGSIKLAADSSIIFSKTNLKPPSLPHAHTCSYEIDIPAYASKEELREKLIFAIFEGQGGFGLI